MSIAGSGHNENQLVREHREEACGFIVNLHCYFNSQVFLKITKARTFKGSGSTHTSSNAILSSQHVVHIYGNSSHNT